MGRKSCVLLAVTCAVAGVVIASAADLPVRTPGSRATWQIPEERAAEQPNPFPPEPALVAYGARLYAGRCEECHGRAPAPETRDGVLFYRIWNGRAAGAMPAFRDRLSREDVWALVAYLKTLQ